MRVSPGDCLSLPTHTQCPNPAPQGDTAPHGGSGTTAAGPQSRTVASVRRGWPMAPGRGRKDQGTAGTTQPLRPRADAELLDGGCGCQVGGWAQVGRPSLPRRDSRKERSGSPAGPAGAQGCSNTRRVHSSAVTLPPPAPDAAAFKPERGEPALSEGGLQLLRGANRDCLPGTLGPCLDSRGRPSSGQPNVGALAVLQRREAPGGPLSGQPAEGSRRSS